MTWYRLPDNTRTKVQGNFSWMTSSPDGRTTHLILIWNAKFWHIETIGL